MARGQRDSVLERVWRGRVAGWATSGLGVRAFCRQQGLSEAVFHFWKRELRARDAGVGGRAAVRSPATQVTAAQSPGPDSAASKSAAAKSGSVPPLFVPVTVVPGATLAVEVRCPSGHVVLLPECEVASLASVFAALTPQTRETPSC